MSRHRSRWYAGAMSLALASFAHLGVPGQCRRPEPGQGKAAGPASAPRLRSARCAPRATPAPITSGSPASRSPGEPGPPSRGRPDRQAHRCCQRSRHPHRGCLGRAARGHGLGPGPSGMASAAKASKRPRDKGTTAKASAKRPWWLASAPPTPESSGDRPGATQIRARATAPYAGGVQAGSDDVLLTVAAAGGSSKAGMPPARRPPGPPSPLRPESSSSPRRGEGRRASVPAATGTRAGSPCDTTVTGSWSTRTRPASGTEPQRPGPGVDADTFGDTPSPPVSRTGTAVTHLLRLELGGLPRLRHGRRLRQVRHRELDLEGPARR